MQKRCLKSLHPALLSRVLVRLMKQAGIAPQRMSVMEAIMDALESENAVVNLTGDVHASIGKRYLCLTRADALQGETPLCVPGVTDTSFGRFEVYPAPEHETGDGKRAQRMPTQLLEGAFVSSRREGDMMIPFGKRTPVKLKKLMIDAGIERAMRASVPLVRAQDGSILFAVGLRPSERCREECGEQMIVRFLGKCPCGEE